MEQELIIKAKDIFKSSSEKWNSFLELEALKDKIINIWNSKLQDTLEKKLVLSEEWEFNKHGMQWYLKEFGESSLSIWLEREHFSLWADCNLFDNDLINDKLKESRYKSIYNGILNKDSGYDGNYFIVETGRFEFNSVYDNNFDSNHLAWFAGNQTEEFVQQIERKLQPFINSESTSLFIELNSLSKR